MSNTGIGYLLNQPLWIPDQPTPCQQAPDMWFPEKGGATKASIEACSHCPVRRECAEAAFTQRERHGIWGGIPAVQRIYLRRKATS